MCLSTAVMQSFLVTCTYVMCRYMHTCAQKPSHSSLLVLLTCGMSLWHYIARHGVPQEASLEKFNKVSQGTQVYSSPPGGEN